MTTLRAITTPEALAAWFGILTDELRALPPAKRAQPATAAAAVRAYNACHKRWRKLCPARASDPAAAPPAQPGDQLGVVIARAAELAGRFPALPSAPPTPIEQEPPAKPKTRKK